MRKGLIITKPREFALHLSRIARILRIIWTAAGYWTLGWAVLLFVQGILPSVMVYLTRPLIDSLVPLVNAGPTWQVIQPTISLAGLLILVILLGQILQGFGAWINTILAEYIKDYLMGLIHQKASTVDLEFYETPQYYDSLIRARQESGNRPVVILRSLGNLLQNSVMVVTLVALLVPYGLWIPLVLVVGTIPSICVLIYFKRQHHQWWERTTPDNRWLEYYSVALTHVMFAAEVRLFDLGEYFQSAYQQLRHRLRSERLAILRNQSFFQFAANFFALLSSGGVMIWILWRVIQGLATLGDLALFYQTFNRGQRATGSLMGNFEQLYSSALFLGNLFDFLDQEPKLVSPSSPLPIQVSSQKAIRFRDVTFYYPGTTRAALRSFNLTISAGQTAAIVGANGAGKSTLLKLLCRFYDPKSGSIELDGIDIRHFSVDEFRRLITVLFQDPVSYHASAAQNIALGDLTAKLNPAEIKAAAVSAGAHEVINRLPQGYETLLGKAYTGGAELSGGEWQRIALARAFVRQAQIIILDEPTSALDSWSEADWFDRFRQLANGRTAILITHRFTTAMQADIIHVMDQGQIIESGTHAELMALNGRYAQSWLTQMRSGAVQDDNMAAIKDSPPPAGGTNGHLAHGAARPAPDHPATARR